MNIHKATAIADI